jgi:hypothetical protein
MKRRIYVLLFFCPLFFRGFGFPGLLGEVFGGLRASEGRLGGGGDSDMLKCVSMGGDPVSGSVCVDARCEACEMLEEFHILSQASTRFKVVTPSLPPRA